MNEWRIVRHCDKCHYAEIEVRPVGAGYWHHATIEEVQACGLKLVETKNFDDQSPLSKPM